MITYRVRFSRKNPASPFCEDVVHDRDTFGEAVHLISTLLSNDSVEEFVVLKIKNDNSVIDRLQEISGKIFWLLKSMGA